MFFTNDKFIFLGLQIQTNCLIRDWNYWSIICLPAYTCCFLWFPDADSEIRRQIVQSFSSNKLRRHALTDHIMTLTKLLEIAWINEVSEIQAQEMEKHPGTTQNRSQGPASSTIQGCTHYCTSVHMLLTVAVHSLTKESALQMATHATTVGKLIIWQK